MSAKILGLTSANMYLCPKKEDEGTTYYFVDYCWDINCSCSTGFSQK